MTSYFLTKNRDLEASLTILSFRNISSQLEFLFFVLRLFAWQWRFRLNAIFLPKIFAKIRKKLFRRFMFRRCSTFPIETFFYNAKLYLRKGKLRRIDLANVVVCLSLLSLLSRRSVRLQFDSLSLQSLPINDVYRLY